MGELFPGVATKDYSIPALAAGTYNVPVHRPPQHGRHDRGGGLTDGPPRPAPRPAAAACSAGCSTPTAGPGPVVKAAFWFVVIILLLGYLPDRAYYFTVQKTVDVGLLAWSPINFCPPENEGMPCPVPAGATLPWHPAPEEVRPPRGPDRRRGRGDRPDVHLRRRQRQRAGAQRRRRTSRTRSAPATSTPGPPGPALPEARADAAYVVLGNTLYVIGGFGPDGTPTDTVYSLTVGNDGSLPDAWVDGGGGQAARGRAPVRPPSRSRTGSCSWAAPDGTAVTNTVWKSKQATGGGLGEWVPQSPLFEANVDGIAAHTGDVDLPDRRPERRRGGRRDGPAGPRRRPRRAGRRPQRDRRPVARVSPDQPARAAVGHVRLHRQRRDLRPGRQRRHRPSRPRRTGPSPTPTAIIGGWKSLDQTDLGQGIEGLGRGRLRLARVPHRRPHAPGRHERHRPHEPRAAGAVLPGSASWD